MDNLCQSIGGNVAEIACAPRMAKPMYILLTNGKTFSQSDMASSTAFKTALTAAMNKPTGDPDKVYCFPVIREVDDNTEEPETGTLQDGYSEVLSEKAPAYTFRTTGSYCQAQSMASFNGWSDKAYIIDTNKRLFYVRTSAGGAQGWSVGSIYTNPPRWAGGGAIVTTSTKLSLGNLDEFKGDVGVLQVDFNPTKLVNLQDVILKEVDTAVGYVFTIGGSVKCSNTNIYTSYKTLLAVAGAWTAKRLDTNASVSITTVTADDAHSGWDITLDNGTAIATGTKIEINLASPAALAALGTPVTGIEGIKVVATKAA